MTADERNATRVFVASVNLDLPEGDLNTVFEAFGPVVSCLLAPDASQRYAGRHLGYGFIEYETAAAAADAIGSMNLMDLGGKPLRVCRATTLPEFSFTTRPAASLPPPGALVGRLLTGGVAPPTIAANMALTAGGPVAHHVQAQAVVRHQGHEVDRGGHRVERLQCRLIGRQRSR